jgi:SAM-dependent methyltransferase
MKRVQSPPEGMVGQYRDAFRQHGRNEASLLWTKNKQSVRFAALCSTIADSEATVLDYGCGLGDLAIWLRQNRPGTAYTGVDAVPEFIDDNRSKFPGVSFAQVNGPGDVQGSFDHIVCSGVFNLNPGGDDDAHWTYVQDMLAALFVHAQRALHVDFLAHDVEYRQQGAYHQDIVSLTRFVEEKLSRRYLLDRTYMPYEYCITVFRDIAIERPRNIYAPDG